MDDDDGRPGYDCTACGACCAMDWIVPLEAVDLERMAPPTRLRVLVDGAHPSLPLVLPTREGRCVFLDGVVGQAAPCSIYEARPDACRAFEAGSAMCKRAREVRGLPI